MLIIGSLALDTIEVEEKVYNDILGGAATYFALSARFFTECRIVAAVGEDFPEDYFKLLNTLLINTEEVQIKKGRSFRWRAFYDGKTLHTLSTEPNVFEDFSPSLEKWRGHHLFLANIHPSLQREALKQVHPPFAVADTMDYWIENEKEELLLLLKELDVLFLNREEARALSGKDNLFLAAKELLLMGPKRVIIKKGEDGAMMVTKNAFFFCPPFPSPYVKDPTGCGDAFAGACMGYLVERGLWSEEDWRHACMFGAAAASFCLEEVGIEGMVRMQREELFKRKKMLQESIWM